MQDEVLGLRELLGEARAIHFSMRYGAISYEQAKLRTKPLLLQINTAIELIAQKHKVKPSYISFQNLGNNI